MDCMLKERGDGDAKISLDGRCGRRFEKRGDPKMVLGHQVQISGNNYNKSKLHS